MLAAFEPRLKGSVFQSSGIENEGAPELDAVNYAPHVLTPTLMINGKYDFGQPVETTQRPLFDLLGAPDKTFRVLEAGHKLPNDAVAAEMLPWLDRVLGPVGR